VGRALHADPAWPRAVLADRAPRPCIACNQGCIDQLHTQQPIWCVVNPDTSHEGRPSFPARPRRVLVLGAGPAGLEAATRAARRGHTVTLLEAQPHLGGQFRRIPGHPEFARLLDWYQGELARLRVRVRLSATATPDEIAAQTPDAVIVATGGVGRRPVVPGAGLSHVIDIRDWLLSPAAVAAVTVWGADRAGLAVADAVAATGAHVLLLGSQSEPAPEAGPREKGPAVERLRQNPRVRIQLCSTVEAIGLDRLLIGTDGRRSWIRAPGPVLVSAGVVPAPVDTGRGTWRTYVIGDAGAGMSAADAIHQAAAVVDALA
jgi:NADPH-dependent 2,4-dienoyl-CoA reductase/sulfur reductase-like enzyme